MPRKSRNGIASGKDQLSCASKASALVPPACDTNGAEGLGHSDGADKSTVDMPSPPHRHSDDPRIQKIMAIARERQYWMSMRLRNTARLVAEIRRILQPARAQNETWDKSTKAKALKIAAQAVAHQKRRIENAARQAIGAKPRKDAPEPEHPAGRLSFVRKTAASIAEWELEEDAVLASMVDIASTLDIAPFVDPERKGFTLAGLAVLIGHAGHPLDYPKKGHLWKRLGLAPYQKDGVTRAGSSWGRYGGLSKEDWIDLGYKRSRLGDIFGKITQPLLYAQWGPLVRRKNKDDEKFPAVALGPYGEAYGHYKVRQIELNEACAFAEEAARQAVSAKKAGKPVRKELLEGKLTPAAINARALRYMTKKLIADLWSAWRRLDLVRVGDKPRFAMSAAAAPFEGLARAHVPAAEANHVLPTPRPVEPEANHQMPEKARRLLLPAQPFPAAMAKKRLFDDIAEGLGEAIAIAKGERVT